MRISKNIIIVISASFILINSVISQEDTTKNDSIVYYTNLSDLFALNIFSSYRNNSMFISNSKTNSTLELIPNSPVSIGAGFGYKGIALSLGFGLPHTKSNIQKYGNTTSFDMRGRFSLKKFGGFGYIQYYKGYYNRNPQDFIEWNKDYYPQIPDLRTFSFGGTGYYILNSDKFSNKAAYSRSQAQNKSAGTLVLGVFLNYDDAQSPKGFYPSDFPDSISSDLNLTGFRYFASGISIGYSYTLVFSRSFYFNIDINPGAGYKDVKVTTTDGETDIKKTAHAQLAIRAALCFENRYIYAGITGSTLLRNIKSNDYNINLATEQLRIYIGKRFSLGTQ